ncbi:MAG: hypothetical protein U9N59_12250 [Campylobacterota bacterium]|nr:hypothetical protein [Campylobacterota bacterium]
MRKQSNKNLSSILNTKYKENENINILDHKICFLGFDIEEMFSFIDFLDTNTNFFKDKILKSNYGVNEVLLEDNNFTDEEYLCIENLDNLDVGQQEQFIINFDKLINEFVLN